MNVFDCFSGLGGLSLGARMAGMNVLGGIDAEPDAVAVYRSTFPEAAALEHDLLAELPAKILKSANIRRGDVDILVGGPPCQPYSINNHNRGLDDARCRLVSSYLEFVSLLQPRWIVMENVPGFANIAQGKFLKDLINSLKKRGYKSKHAILLSTNFGIPQRRRRLILIATKDECLLQIAFEKLLTYSVPKISLREAIGDLPESPSSSCSYLTKAKGAFQKQMRSGNAQILDNHTGSSLGKVNLERAKHIPPGGNWRDIPRNLLPKGMQRARLSDHTTRYGRLKYENPAYTLLTKCDPHWGCFLHPTQDRVLTVREAARLQSIPDSIKFPSNLSASYRLIGNAVPPLLAKGILETIRLTSLAKISIP